MRALLSLALGFATAGAEQPRAARPPSIASKQEVHAAFTLNLTRFVSWPARTFATPNAPLVIGTFTRDPVNEELDALAQGEEVDGHPVRTMRIRSLDDVARCHVVFLSRGATRATGVLQRVAGKPILTISDEDGFLELGGHVRFVPQPPRVGLRISVENLKASHLECRAQLLRIAAAP